MGRLFFQLRFLLLAAALLFSAVKVQAQRSFVNNSAVVTNFAGRVTDFKFTLTAKAVNFGVVLPGSSASYSFLYLKKGSAASETNYDHVSRLSGQTNSIYLEAPEFAAADWYLRVVTPTNFVGSNTATLTLSTNLGVFKTTRAASKPLAFTVFGVVPKAPSAWHYYRVEVPTNTTLKISLTGATNGMPDIFVHSGQFPTTTSYLKKSGGIKNDLFYVSDAEMPPGACFIGLNSLNMANKYTLKVEVLKVTSLNFDPGTTHLGTDVFTNITTGPTNFYFKVRTINPSVGAWRTVLTVNGAKSGVAPEANLYMLRGTIPTSGASSSYKSELKGSDAVLMGPNQFSAGEDWYIWVNVKTNSQIRVVSGAVHVTDLGELRTDHLSSTNVTIGPEGWRFFKTTMPSDILGWRMTLNGATNSIYLKKTAVPLLSGFELKQDRQLLVVPPYLIGGQSYFIGVPGTNGATVNLDSRQHQVTDIGFASTNNSVTMSGFVTYRVQVPSEQIVWQVNVTPTSGNPNLYIRRNFVPNELNNDALSEAAGLVSDSVVLTPPTLTDGTFFITVVSTNNSTFKVTAGPPTVTDINYVDTVINTETNRAGWRYFRVLSIDQQTNSLGWELTLSNAPAGTRIALRTNQAPSSWQYRSGNVGVNTARSYDLMSLGSFLQQPGHVANIWYIGVYNPSNALGKFTLSTRSIGAELLSGDNVKVSRTNVPSAKWEFFRMDIPTGILGWDLRLTDIGGMPRIVVRREALPVNDISDVVTTNISSTFGPATITNWPSGAQWAPTRDWTQRLLNAGGVNEEGRVLAMGMGRPLQPGTYYIGVFNRGATNSRYTLWSRFIGPGKTIPVRELAYAGGTATNKLVPREAAYYKVVVPPNTPSWKVKLTTDAKSEAMLVVSTNNIPNIESEKRMSKAGNEHYVLLPDRGQRTLRPGDYYLVVVGEGTNPPAGRINAGIASYTLQSLGRMPTNYIGLLSTSNNVLSATNTLEGGESRMYHFSTTNVLGFETVLEFRQGNPVQVSRDTWELPDPGIQGDPYGNEGGETDGLAVSPHRIYVANPSTNETVAIKARTTGGNLYPKASFSLKVNRLIPTPLTFDGGKQVVANHITNSWRFFQVDVPANALGWDVRLTNVLAGNPRMVVCRERLPIALTTSFNPALATNWGEFARWVAGADWTGRSQSANGVTNEDGRILAMGMNRPLEPGRYYIGVWSDPAAKYTLMSRGIGGSYSIPVRDLSFTNTIVAVTSVTNGITVTNYVNLSNAVVTVTNLMPREAAYFRILLPGNAPSWKVRLSPANTNQEVALIASYNAVPNVLATPTSSVTNSSAGRKMQKIGGEEFLLLPSLGQTNLTPRNYYLTVVSEGSPITNVSRIGAGKVGFTLTSVGPLVMTNLGTLNSNLTISGKAAAGECVGYQFTVPKGAVSLEARLENRTNNPVMALRAGPLFPDPGAGINGQPSDLYGNEGGETQGTFMHPNLLTIPNPTNGTYYVIVKGRSVNGNPTNAAFTLKLNVTGSTFLEFDGGTTVVTSQTNGTWKYFRIDVPTNALGWDLRLTNVTGLPKLVLRRDTLPSSLSTVGWGSPGNTTSWPSSNQWAAGMDWTRRQNSPQGVNETGRILAMGMGHPLEPGSYYAGVNATGGSNANYTLLSRGIGPGFIIPVVDLPFTNGSATNQALSPREAAYYRVVMPTNAPSSKLKVTGQSGEVMLIGLRDAIPNTEYFDPNRSIAVGKSFQKSGNEHYLLLPPSPKTNLVFGADEFTTNYFAVIAEGGNLTAPDRIGTGNSSYIISSLGPIQTNYLGVVSATDLVHVQTTLSGGESQLYQFTVTNGTDAVELKLENRVGNPVMVLLYTNALPDAGGGFGSVSSEAYGNEGGFAPTDVNPLLTTIPSPVPGTYTLMIKARSGNGSFSDASYRLRIRRLVIQDLNFGSYLNTNGFTNVVSGILETNQRAFFRVQIPTNINTNSVLGWKLELSHASGMAQIRVRTNALPSDIPSTGTPFVSPAAYIVPPFFTNGTWYVEVRGSNTTEFTLTSRPLEVERPAWIMPGQGQTNLAPGVAAPYFADSNVNTNGITNVIGGLDLEQGYQHFYSIMVPTNNLGLLRVQLEAISGNPDLYTRTNFVPTITHNTSGGSGTIFDRSMVATGNEYANWVPLDGKVETKLKPGLWYFSVGAKTVNTRYRLLFSLGNIRDISVFDTTLANQFVLPNDWIYYRFQMPTAVRVNWKINFSQQTGDVWLYLRDTIPPGNGNSIGDVRSWVGDLKNTGPYEDYNTPGLYTFTTPPCRPGEPFYIGFRGLSQSTFSVSVSTNGGPLVEPIPIGFYPGGAIPNSVVTNLPPNSETIYRIDVPADAARWKHTSTHFADVQLFLEQGTLPNRTSTDDWRSTGLDSSLSQFLLTPLPNGWPWVPSKAYFLIVRNTSLTTRSFSFTMDGKNLLTDDEDNDGLPDAWERQYFGNTGVSPNTDPDGDAVINGQEYLDGTDPTDPNSVVHHRFARGSNSLFVSPKPQIIAPMIGSDGSFQFTLQGMANQTYILEGSDDLVHWDTVTQVVLNESGVATVTDSSPTRLPQRFYRVRRE